MGIDIEIYVRTPPTLDLLQKLRSLAKEQNPDSSLRYPAIGSVTANGKYVHISSCCRYFSGHYPRGWWPDIRAALLAIRDACPPGTQVEYGSDSNDFEGGVPVDAALLSELDMAWAATGKE